MEPRPLADRPLVDVERTPEAILITLRGNPFVLDESSLDALQGVLGSLGSADIVLVRSEHPTIFCAGADVNRIASLTERSEAERLVRRGQEVLASWARHPATTVALVHGGCFGGGVELALACRLRIASDAPSTKFALPEVKLGIVPAWGGCTRLPWVVGLKAALELATTGRSVTAERARRLGLVDSVVPREHLMREGLALARDLQSGRFVRKRRRGLVDRFLDDTSIGRALLTRKARRAILRETRGHYPAPERVLELMRDAVGAAEAESLTRERAVVVELLAGSIHRNLLHLFQITQKSTNVAGRRVPALDPSRTDVVVVGAGVMGAGIAGILVGAGFGVRLIDTQESALVGAFARIHGRLDSAVRKHVLKPHEAAARRARLTASRTLDGLAAAHLVIEAATERTEVKRDLLTRLARACRVDAIMATNTSSIPLAELADVVCDPGRFLGLHFFNPPEKMPLLEIVRGEATSDDTVGFGSSIAAALGKTPIVVRDGPGFLVNRLLSPYLHHATQMALKGAPLGAIDDEILRFGLPMGPFRLMDEVGLDIVAHVGDQARGRPGFDFPPNPLVLELVARGALGRKSGNGFYEYRDGVAGAVSSAAREALQRHGAPTAPFTPSAETLLLPMAGEAQRIVSEGLVESSDAVDLGTVYGLGFPAFRGGLWRWAQERERTS